MRSGFTAMAWETAARQSSTELRSKFDLHRGISSLSRALALPLRSSGQRHLVLVTVRPSDVRNAYTATGSGIRKNATGAQRAYSSSNIPLQTPSSVAPPVLAMVGTDRLAGPPNRHTVETNSLQRDGQEKDPALRTSPEPATTKTRHASRKKHRHAMPTGSRPITTNHNI